jgi:DNA-binding NtrC family response regulator
MRELLSTFRAKERNQAMADQALQDKGILIVEDEPDICEALRQILEHEGFRNVHLALDGRAGLAAMEGPCPDPYLLLLGCKMPVMSGMEVMQHLVRSHKAFLAVIMITAYATVSTAREFFGLESSSLIPVDFVPKPCDRRTLIEDVWLALELIEEKRKGNSAKDVQEIFIGKKENILAALQRRLTVNEEINAKIERFRRKGTHD